MKPDEAPAAGEFSVGPAKRPFPHFPWHPMSHTGEA